jgi:hypothetical protein
MNKYKKLIQYQSKIFREACYMFMQTDPHTAYGEGLTNLSRALGLGGRYDCESNLEYREETDVELRERILNWLETEE